MMRKGWLKGKEKHYSYFANGAMRHREIDVILWRKKFLNLNGPEVHVFAYVKNHRKDVL